VLKVSGAVAPLTVLVNGVPVMGEGRDSLFFNPGGPGFSRVTVMDASGAADSVVVRVDDSGGAVSASKPLDGR
jgi:penicillin-binding protein 1C